MSLKYSQVETRKDQDVHGQYKYVKLSSAKEDPDLEIPHSRKEDSVCEMRQCSIRFAVDQQFSLGHFVEQTVDS